MAKSDVLVRVKADTSNYDANIAKARKQLDDFGKNNMTAGGLIKQMTSTLVSSATKFASFGAAAAAAMKVVKDAFFQSESNIDEWGRTVESAKGAYSVFLDTLNNGNWSNFFQNLSAAIQGGRELYDVFDRLGSIKSNNAAAIAITQKEIAELRLAKQQGENVDAKLKAATERLAALQKQSVSAGMAAGSQSAFQTIRNGVNSIGGAGVNDATIKYVVDKIIKGGQSEFDKYKRNYETLQQRGMVTRTQDISDSQGGTYKRQYKVFDINALTKEQQKQYAIAKAITEGETRIQKGIAAYAQAVSEGTAAAREEFKGNRYSLMGSGSKGGGKSTKGEQTELQQNQSKINTLTQEYVTLGDSATESARQRQAAIREEISLLVKRNDILKLRSEQAQGRLLGDMPFEMPDISRGIGLEPSSEIKGVSLDDKALKALSKQLKDAIPDRKEMKVSDVASNIAGGLSSITSGIEQLGIEIPQGLKDVLGGIQAIATILTGISALISIITAIQGTKAVPVIGWALANGGLVRAAGGYRVPGNFNSGDLVPAALSSGELVLNKSQQASLANQLNDNNMFRNLNIDMVIEAEQLRGVLNNNGRRTGRGEYVQSRRRTR